MVQNHAAAARSAYRWMVGRQPINDVEHSSLQEKVESVMFDFLITLIGFIIDGNVLLHADPHVDGG
jgi:hypothetical protein